MTGVRIKWCDRRGTAWSQGGILKPEDLLALGVSQSGDATIAMAISHDCDIANDNLDAEPDVEFVLGKIVEKADGNYRFGKNPRVLHISMMQSGDPCVVELVASWKVLILKKDLAEYEPDDQLSIDYKSLKILQSWLAARYRRPSLPDALVDRLKPVFGFMEKQGKKYAAGILGYWFDVDPRSGDLPPEEPYELWINIVYTIDFPEAEQNAIDLADSVKEKFPDLMAKTEGFGPVELRYCKAFSEQEFTLRDLRETIEYRLEYLSYRMDPEGPTV